MLPKLAVSQNQTIGNGFRADLVFRLILPVFRVIWLWHFNPLFLARYTSDNLGSLVYKVTVPIRYSNPPGMGMPRGRECKSALDAKTVSA